MKAINAKNKILGRVCANIAHELLTSRDKIIVVNARGALITGRKEAIFKIHVDRAKKGVRGNQLIGPKYPRYPDKIILRTVRGMLPRTARGFSALKRLNVFIDLPDEFKKDLAKEDIKTISNSISLGALAKHLGAQLRNVKE
ncbi:MAG: uL13 family ribosomal protein [archaeon]